MPCQHGKPSGRCQACQDEALEELYGDGSANYDERWPGLSQKKAKGADDS